MKESNITFAALVVLLLLVWFGGQLLGFSEKLRAGIVVGLLALWMVLYVLQKAVAVRRAKAIEDRLRAQAQEQMASARPDKRPEVEALERQLNEAIAALKSSRLGTGALYALPWYVIIGPPGSGKSTALLKSDLNFPYTSKEGKIRGVGGTRNCDWWFTDQGILLDTAGRYTTELEDRDEWLAFLDMVKRCRKHKPINGALVCVSVADLLKASDDELEQHAKTIRERLDELTKRLELVFPVYLLFTKCDLFNGFVEFFEDFGKGDRSQAWGCTLSYTPAPNTNYKQLFEERVRELYAQVCAHRASALAAERPPDRKRQIYSFPLQFAFGQRRLAEFVGELFRPNPFQESSVFRGFYFTSGTQEGTPIDQLVQVMSQAFGLGETPAAFVSQQVEKKSYFINHLFTKIIFPDQGLARRSSAAQKRRMLVQWGTLAGSAAASLALFVGLLVSFFGNWGLLRDMDAAAQQVRGAPSDPAASLAALEHLRQEIHRLDQYETAGRPLGLRWGLYRGTTVRDAARRLHFARLQPLFADRLGKLLRDELEQRQDKSSKSEKDYQEIYELVRAYSMLAGETAPDPELIGLLLKDRDRWLRALTEDPSSLPDDQKRAATEQLAFFVMQLDRPDRPKIGYDKALVRRIIQELKATPVPLTQGYRTLLDMLRGTVRNVTRDTALADSPGRDLLKIPYEFPELFTQDGYIKYMRGPIDEKARQLADWYGSFETKKTVDEIRNELGGLYVAEYVLHWEQYLKSTRLVDFTDIQNATESLRVLSSPQESPYGTLFRAVREKQTIQLSETDRLRNKPSDDFRWMDKALSALSELHRAMEHFRKQTSPGSRVTTGLTGGQLKTVTEAVSKASSGLDAALGEADPRYRDAYRLVLMQAVEHARRAVVSEAQREVNAQWSEQVFKRWKQECEGRFPFAGPDKADVALNAFSELFSPGSGAFWKLYGQLEQLERGFIMNEKPLITFSHDFRDAVQRAQRFRDALFAKDGAAVALRFKVLLIQRVGVQDIELSLGNEGLTFYENPDHSKWLTWTEGKSAGARLSIRVGEDQQASDEHDFSKQPWGLLRLVRKGALKRLTEKSFGCTWVMKVFVRSMGKEDTFTVEAEFETETRLDPFSPEFFDRFACPSEVDRPNAQ